MKMAYIGNCVSDEVVFSGFLVPWKLLNSVVLVLACCITNDEVCERDEEFVVMLYIPEESAVYGVRAGTPGKATVTIKDDDSKLTNSA